MKQLNDAKLWIKWSQLGAFGPWATVYCYLEFKFRYLKNVELSLDKELFEPIVLQEKKRRFLLFLKAFPWETDLWVTLGDFTVRTQNWEGKSVFN